MVRGSGVLVIVQWSDEECLWLNVFCVCPAGEGSRAGMVSGGVWLWFVPAGEWGRGGLCSWGGPCFGSCDVFHVWRREYCVGVGGVAGVLRFVGGESGVVVLWWC